MILETAALVWVLIKVGTDIGTAIENNIINAAIDAVTQKQQPSLNTLGLSVGNLRRGQRDLLAEQTKIRTDQRRQIEAHYKSGEDCLRSALLTGKKEHRMELIKNASDKFIDAKNVEVEGKAAARAALLVGACYHLLYCIDTEHGTANENDWYEKAFQLAEQSRGPDGKPPRELIRELLGLPYLSGKYGTFEVYWQKWDPPKRIEPPPKLLPSPQSFQSPRSRAIDRPVPGIYQCSRCGKTFTPSFEQFIELRIPDSFLYCPECWNNI